jgi:F-type H+-transporting ATPase subunit delta
MIVQNKRESYIPDITRRFIYDYKNHRGITTVVLTTVVPLDNQLKDKITQMIHDAYHSTVEIEEKQKENLIGGFIIRIDDNMMDASVARELQRMRKNLITKEFKHH